MTAFTIDTSVGDIVKDRPARSRVFEQHKIDYCCGGKLPLSEACQRRGIDAATVLEALRASDANAGADPHLIDADAMTLTALANHIEQTHHAYLQEELPRLGAMVRKVAAVHGDRFPWMIEVDQVFAGMADELKAHMFKEEQILFPLIRSLENGSPRPGHHCGMSIANPIAVMEHEHDDAGAALDRMHTLTDSYTPPSDACNTFRAMLDGLAQLEADMHQHVHKENNVLFPKALALECSVQSADAVTP